MQTIQIETKPKRNMFGKLSGMFTASIAGWEATAKTRDEAKAALLARLQRQHEHMHARRYVRANGNVTFALYYADGWQYDIVRDNGSCSSCCMHAVSYSEALGRMMEHVKRWNESEPANN